MLKKLHIVQLLLVTTRPVWSRASSQVSLGPGAGSARGLYDQIVQKINQGHSAQKNQPQQGRVSQFQPTATHQIQFQQHQQEFQQNQPQQPQFQGTQFRQNPQQFNQNVQQFQQNQPQ